MTPSRVAFTLLLVIFVAFLAVGCTATIPDIKNQTKNATLTTTIATTAPTATMISELPVAMFCPHQEAAPNSIISGEPFIFKSRIPNPDVANIRVWLFGPNTAKMIGQYALTSDKNNITLSGKVTYDLKNGTYVVIFQYPDESGHFDVGMNNENQPAWILNKNGDLVLDTSIVQKGGMTGGDAANILGQAIVASGSDQMIERTTINITEAWIAINPIGNHTVGEKFPIMGTTNLLPGDEIYFYDIHPVNYHPSQFRQEWDSAHGAAAPYRVREGSCGKNTWSIDVDSSTFKPDEYFFAVTSLDRIAYANQEFQMNAVRPPSQNLTLE